MTRYFHFTLGPVQSFVAQARRTRDFWAGSFILSWLSAVAMREVIAQQGDIRFPQPEPQFMEWLEGKRKGKNGLAQANVPNRFTALVDYQRFDAKKVERAVCDAWLGLAEKVWEQDLAGLDDQATREIWDRQVEGFWEIAWALVDKAEDTAVLDQRKNWRSHLPPEEPGIKCMVMDGWQELSGATSPTQPHKARLDDFWKQLREKNDAMRRDLRPREHLCALAFIKRRFPRHFQHVSVAMPSVWTAHGWKVPQTVPSVVYLAAVPWLAEVIKTVEPATLKQFHDEAKKLPRSDPEWTIYDEWPTEIRRIQEAIQKKGSGCIEYRFRALEGGAFFDTTLEDRNQFENEEQARRVLAELRNLRHEAGKGAASSFYAVLRMDGDEIGKHMSVEEKQPAITEALASFTTLVPKVVYGHDGFLIYAGGDDVLALLPIDTALPCACALREMFGQAFEEAFDACNTTPAERFAATLSGAIEFAHMKMPLTRVLFDSQHLLDEVAKNGRGRDAIACRVWKPGHKALEWAIPWEMAVQDRRVVVQELAQAFARQEKEAPFASRFFYRIRERLELLQPRKGGANTLTPHQALQLMTAEYLGSGVNEGRQDNIRISAAEAGEIVGRLLKQCQSWKRIPKADGTYEYKSEDRWEADAALLVRFLAQKGVDR